MNRLLPLLLLLTGLPAAAGGPDELVRVDVRGTATSIEAIRREVSALGPLERERARASVGVLIATCPYTRAALQLPFALHGVVSAVDPAQLDPRIRRDWEQLTAGLGSHVAVLRALGVDRSVPARDPLGAMASLVLGIPADAARIDARTWEALDEHSARVEQITGVVRPCPRGPWSPAPGHPWTLGAHLAGWHDALRRVRPFVEDPHITADVDGMIDLLELYAEISVD